MDPYLFDLGSAFGMQIGIGIHKYKLIKKTVEILRKEVNLGKSVKFEGVLDIYRGSHLFNALPL